MTTTTASNVLNGINTDDFRALVSAVSTNPVSAQTRWSVTTEWQGGTVSESRVRGCEIAGQWIPRPFALTIDEPLQLGGTNTHANPQEYLLAALNACMTVGYVLVATSMGIELDHLEIKTEGNIDLHGALDLPSLSPVGYDGLHYTVRIKAANATRAQLQKIHDTVTRTSPNRFNLASPIPMTSTLEVL